MELSFLQPPRQPMQTKQFRTGDECIVLGDSMDECHEFAPQTKVTLVQYSESSTNEGTYIWSCEGSNDWWWVNEQDLKLIAGEEPTDEEVAQVFGLVPQPTDADYLRKLSTDNRVPTNVQKEIRDYLKEKS